MNEAWLLKLLSTLYCSIQSRCPTFQHGLCKTPFTRTFYFSLSFRKQMIKFKAILISILQYFFAFDFLLLQTSPLLYYTWIIYRWWLTTIYILWSIQLTKPGACNEMHITIIGLEAYDHGSVSQRIQPFCSLHEVYLRFLHKVTWIFIIK